LNSLYIPVVAMKKDRGLYILTVWRRLWREGIAEV